ncbi:hypothetical protein CF326_g8873 [Tilletia indica]|nr:hypothetical protein CF326_g8873 [Tilletia indica]
MLSKDHFAKILNEVAGHIAKIIVKHTVNNVVKAWDDQGMSVDQIVDESLACMFHPYWHHPQAIVQREMLEYIESWSRTHHNEIRRLDRQNCRNHTDTRTGKPEEHSHGHGGGHNNNQQQQVPGGVGGKFGAQAAGAFSNYMGGKVQGMMPQQLTNTLNQFGSREAGEGESAGYYGGGGGGGNESGGQGRGGEYGRNESEGYGGQGQGHGHQGQGSGGGYGQPEPQYGSGGGGGGGQGWNREPEYGSGGGGGGYNAPPSMPNESQYIGGGGGGGGGYGGGDGGYGGGYAAPSGPPPGGFPAPNFGGEGGGQYGGGNDGSMYPGQQHHQQQQQQGGWNPPQNQNQGYGGNYSSY